MNSIDPKGIDIETILDDLYANEISASISYNVSPATISRLAV